METSTLSQQSRLEHNHWWYAGRRKIVRSLLGAIPSRALILDAGSGPGGNRSILPASVRVYALDPALHSLRLSQVHPYEGWIQGDLTCLPIGTNSLDLVVVMDVLEHLDEDGRAADEIFRVLRPGGTVLVTVPAFQWLWGLQDRLSHHKRRYTKPQLLTLLGNSGFEIVRSTYFNTFMLGPIWLGRKLLDLLPHKLESEGQITMPGVNTLVRWLFSSERFFLRVMNFPFGVSIYCLAAKPRSS